MAVFLAILGAAGIAIYLLSLSSSADRRRNRLRFIDSLRGRCLKGPGEIVELEDRIVVPFQLAERDARLIIADAGGRTGVELSGTGGALHVFQDGVHASFRNREDRTVGDPVFDAAWVVQGDLAEALFAPESRAEAVAAIHALRPYVDPCVEISGGFLRVSVGQPPESEPAVRALVNAARTVLESLGPRVANGMICVEIRQDGLSICQVCGVGGAGARVVCRSCRTPHHEDCWRYVGRCSTYGCGGRELLRMPAR